jgi:molecular chaperone GrpE
MGPEDEVVTAEVVDEDTPGADSDAPERLTPAALGIDLPADHDEAIDALIDAVATARAAADRYLDDLQRLAAEFENYRKRVQRDRDDIVQRSSQRVV